MNNQIKSYADALYQKYVSESATELANERSEYLNKMVKLQRGPYNLLSGPEIQAAAARYVNHIERCMKGRLESYRTAYADAGEIPTQEDFTTILNDFKAVREKQTELATGAINNYIASRGGSHLPAGAMEVHNLVLGGSARGHDRVLDEWKIWRAKIGLQKSNGSQSTSIDKSSVESPLEKDSSMTQESSGLPWYESNLFSLSVGTGVALVLFRLNYLFPDSPWPLWLAVPCFAVASWVVFRRLKPTWRKWTLVSVVTAVTWLLLFGLNWKWKSRTATDNHPNPSTETQSTTSKTDHQAPTVAPQPAAAAASETEQTPTKKPKAVKPKVKEPTHEAEKPAASTTQPSVTLNNSPGSAVSYGQQGGITAGTINIGPQERHLTEPQKTALATLADSLPENASEWFFVEASNDANSITYASEMEDVFNKHGKSKSLITRLAERPPVPRGVCVIASGTESENFDVAQKIANTLVQNGIPVRFFGRGTGLNSKQVKIVIGPD